MQIAGAVNFEELYRSRLCIQNMKPAHNKVQHCKRRNRVTSLLGEQIQ